MPYDTTIDMSYEATGDLNTNYNYLSPTTFIMTMDRLKFPNANFHLQTVMLPDMMANPAQLGTPKRRIPMSADKIEYGPLTVTFLVDEDLTNYREMHDWLLAQVLNVDQKNDGKPRDLTLTAQTSSNNPNVGFQFIDAYPTQISALPFETTTTDIQYLTTMVTIEYSYFKII